jgi:hypothetical protein
LKKAVGVIAAALALGVFAAAPASAGQADVVRGAKYKAEYSTGAGMTYPLKIKVRQNGKIGTFTLKCAGVKRAEIEIKKGHFKLAFGADEVMVKGRGHFLKNDQVKGAITKVITPGATCAGGGDFFGAAEDTD